MDFLPYLQSDPVFPYYTVNVWLPSDVKLALGILVVGFFLGAVLAAIKFVVRVAQILAMVWGV